jgi:hypothetical protein
MWDYFNRPPLWAKRLEEKIMSSFDDLKAALDSISGKVSTVKTDVDALLAKLSSIPTAGMTPEQQASLDAAVSQAQGIATSLTAIDAEANPPTPPAAATAG